MVWRFASARRDPQRQKHQVIKSVRKKTSYARIPISSFTGVSQAAFSLGAHPDLVVLQIICHHRSRRIWGRIALNGLVKPFRSTVLSLGILISSPLTYQFGGEG